MYVTEIEKFQFYFFKKIYLTPVHFSTFPNAIMQFIQLPIPLYWINFLPIQTIFKFKGTDIIKKKSQHVWLCSHQSWGIYQSPC